MNSRVKTQLGLVVLGLIILQITASLTRADELAWDLLKTEKIKIEAASSGQGQVLTSYPAFMQKLLTQVLKWDPRKELNNSTQLGKFVENGFEKEEHKVDLSELLRNLSVDFDVSNTENFRKVWFQLTPTLKVRGLFGIHDFKNRRPLIILRMGIHGNVDELLAERFIAKAVYEDLDSNFLILENLTSHAFLTKNKEISFGGVEEGLHTFLILKYLNDSGYYLNKLVTNYHLIGVSLGGQGTFVTSLMEHYNQRHLKSILNMCPLINLKSTFDFHAQKGFLNAGVDIWNTIRLRSIQNNYSEQMKGTAQWKTWFDMIPRFTPRILKILNEERSSPLLSADQLQAQIPKLIWPEGFREIITKSKSFYEMNDFWRVYRGDDTPMTIYTTPKDFLVVNDLNSDLIIDRKQPGDFRHVKIEKLNRGMHCGLASVYLWDDVVAMIRKGLQL